MSESPIDHAKLQLIRSYHADRRARRIGQASLPSRERMVRIIDLVLEAFFPGYYGRSDVSTANLDVHVTALLATLHETLRGEVERCFCFLAELEGKEHEHGRCVARGREVSDEVLGKLGELRDRLVLDVQAAFDGDPAAGSLDEIILAYPGYRAVVVYRVAHELWTRGVPLLPRMMTEWAHAQTGADIHPGATIGERFFIDHATGVVIGETSRIGSNVRMYQGVTLGAISHPTDAAGRVIRGTKRHPTVEDGVTLYANASILGGQTTIGEGSVVGGAVFLTKSVPKRSRIGARPPELRVIEVGDEGDQQFPMEFEI